jgi:hypothetical protein
LRQEIQTGANGGTRSTRGGRVPLIEWDKSHPQLLGISFCLAIWSLYVYRDHTVKTERKKNEFFVKLRLEIKNKFSIKKQKSTADPHIKNEVLEWGAAAPQTSKAFTGVQQF